MSWNKNTVIESELGAVISVLENVGVPYILAELGKVGGRGLNDGDGTSYTLRQLAYGDWIILERMVLTCDCDTDDYVTSTTFRKQDAPERWALEVEECVCGYSCVSQG